MLRFISSSLEVLDQLEVTTSLLGDVIESRAAQIHARVPSCVAVSVALAPTGLTLTLLADLRTLTLGIPPDELVDASSTDALDERDWHHLRAQDPDACCATSLALPFWTPIGATGYLTIYASDPHAFDDIDTVLSAAGAAGETPVTNHDLSMRGLEDAVHGPDVLAELDTIELAVGYLMGALRVTHDEARRILQLGAARRGVDISTHARTVIDPKRGQH